MSFCRRDGRSCASRQLGNCSCITLPPASMQSCSRRCSRPLLPAIAPALLYLPTSMWVAGAALPPRQLLPALLYLLHPWSRPSLESYLRTSLGNCSCVTLPPPSMESCGSPRKQPWIRTSLYITRGLDAHPGNCSRRCSRPLFPTRLYRLHPWRRTSPHPCGSLRYTAFAMCRRHKCREGQATAMDGGRYDYTDGGGRVLPGARTESRAGRLHGCRR
jgi:hypothetical protein